MPPNAARSKLKGYFITRDGKSFAGSHLIIELRNAKRLDDIDHIEQTLVEAVNAAGATLLHIHLHHFSPGGGVSGVAVLSEWHISIHTWPEHGFAALECSCAETATHMTPSRCSSAPSNRRRSTYRTSCAARSVSQPAGVDVDLHDTAELIAAADLTAQR